MPGGQRWPTRIEPVGNKEKEGHMARLKNSIKPIVEYFTEIKLGGDYIGDLFHLDMDMSDVAPIQEKLLRNGWTLVDRTFHAEIRMDPERQYGELVATTNEEYGHYSYGLWRLTHGYHAEIAPSGIDGDVESAAMSFSKVDLRDEDGIKGAL